MCCLVGKEGGEEEKGVEVDEDTPPTPAVLVDVLGEAGAPEGTHSFVAFDFKVDDRTAETIIKKEIMPQVGSYYRFRNYRKLTKNMFHTNLKLLL